MSDLEDTMLSYKCLNSSFLNSHMHTLVPMIVGCNRDLKYSERANIPFKYNM